MKLELSLCIILSLILDYMAKLRNHFSCAAFIPFLATPIFVCRIFPSGRMGKGSPPHQLKIPPPSPNLEKSPPPKVKSPQLNNNCQVIIQ